MHWADLWEPVFAKSCLHPALRGGMAIAMTSHQDIEIRIDSARVPYRDAVGAFNDLSEGRINLVDGAFAIARPHLEAGKIMPFYVLPESDLLKLPPSEAPLSWN